MRCALTVFWILLAGSAFADAYVRQPFLDVIHYDIAVEWADQSGSIEGTAKIRILILGENIKGMWLNFEDMVVDRLLVGGRERPFAFRNGRLEFEFGTSYSRNAVALVEVRYHGTPREGLLTSKNRYGRRVVFADNWPDNARHWFPCIDHPSDKAPATITVTAPERYDVVANGRLAKTVSLPDGRRKTQWVESRAIPTYCIVIGAAEFSVRNAGELNGVPINWYAYPEDSELVSLKFSRTADIISYFEKIIGPYPYEKLAQVESAISGAMENASAIFYSESYFLGNRVWEEPVAHEIAHQWFGNSVTESDWDHLWLSEGFASYFEALFYEQMNGHAKLNEIMDRYSRKIRDYESAGTIPIVDSRQVEPRAKLNPISYEKGAWVLHMLRGVLGDKVFFSGIRQYYRDYQGRNASSEDFQKAMQSASGRDLSGFFRQWLYQPGWPEYHLQWRWKESTGEAEIALNQEQNTGLFDMPVDLVIFGSGLQPETHKIRAANKKNTFQIPFPAMPSKIEIDPDGWVLKSTVVSSQ